MKTPARWICFAGFIALVVVTTCGRLASAQATAAPRTLWSFLGFRGGLTNRLVNRRGLHPGMEKKPPLLGIADSANLKSDIPAIKKAAEVKQQEDLAKQKIKAIRYLTSIGCGCYDKDGGISDALAAAMDDCTEKVRLVAIQAITRAAEDGTCAQCSEKRCCNEKIVKQLAKIAYERDDHGCWLEPSERVRQAATKALATCCSNPVPVTVIEEEPPSVEETELPVEQGGELPEVPTAPPAAPPAAAPTPPSDDTTTQRASPQFLSSRRHAAANGWVAKPPTDADSTAGHHAGSQAKPPRQGTRIIDAALRMVSRQVAGTPAHRFADSQIVRVPPVAVSGRETAALVAPVLGTVEKVDLGRGLLQVRFAASAPLSIGQQARVFHQYLTGRAAVGLFQVVQSGARSALLRPIGHAVLHKVGRGDQVVTLSHSGAASVRSRGAD